MAKQAVLVVCPGRGTYNAPELGYLARHHGALRDSRSFDAIRAAKGAPTLSELDGAARFSASLHQRGENAAPLIYAASWLDFLALDRERLEVVAVTGNSMGWYTALACAGAVSGEHGFAIADAMGVNSGRHGDGGQLLLTLVGEDWTPDPVFRAHIERLIEKHGVHRSIDLGGMLVIAGGGAQLDRFQAALPALPGRAPMRLAGHGPFHTPLMAESSRAALSDLSAGDFGRPDVPLIDGTGRVWRRFETDPAALHAYTFTPQILEAYDFAKAIEVGIKEFAPDRIVLLGPGDTLGGAIGQVLVRERWLGITDKTAFAARQATDPFLIAMGRSDQRTLASAG
ncbi:MAG TPA: ACP S-malonyltransferase [Novosphingobium sp.]|nr:ACP S-malonyltransferase [Novosphingobium sp.]